LLGMVAAVALHGCGGHGPTTVEIVVPRLLVRIASIAPTGTAVVDVTELTFTGTGADLEALPVQLDWDFGDGARATGWTVTHVYKSTGTRTVTLRGSTSDGAVQSDDQQVRVASLTGVWQTLFNTVPTDHPAVITQSGRAIRGYYENLPLSFTGNLEPPRDVVLYLTFEDRCPGLERIARGHVSGDRDISLITVSGPNCEGVSNNYAFRR
jgi:PKD domain